ncbi:MAG TPA: helix-turn-helix domain-containing protein [Romboutsia timonensis]|uniref:Helix-turn-helix domain-containing protein n=1 Tax=Romboutsia timonensis TaxID=1776391 RepID=A0A921SZJ1_9FIRM|nr:helix-turn-helix domain-containing protein [Romboutsia timonensis]
MAKLIDFNLVECDEILFEKTSLQSYGYGIVSQLPMKDREMSIQAKGVYAYLVSCAGNDKQTYPTKEKMCYDLGIKKVDTLSKYIKQIQARGYIKIVKTKRDNLKYKNVYLIATDTRTIEIWKREFEEGKEIEEAEVIAENKKSLTYGEVKDNENKEVPTYDEVETNNLENSFDNNIISDNEEKYNRKFIKNEENISNKCEDDDIEAKNKRLMEEEKVFVPSFRGWN